MHSYETPSDFLLLFLACFLANPFCFFLLRVDCSCWDRAPSPAVAKATLLLLPAPPCTDDDGSLSRSTACSSPSRRRMHGADEDADEDEDAEGDADEVADEAGDGDLPLASARRRKKSFRGTFLAPSSCLYDMPMPKSHMLNPHRSSSFATAQHCTVPAPLTSGSLNPLRLV
jgi:hypothetical protein